MFENLDACSDKYFPEKAILLISFFLIYLKISGCKFKYCFLFFVSLGEEIRTIQGTILLVLVANQSCHIAASFLR